MPMRVCKQITERERKKIKRRQVLMHARMVR